MTKKTKRHIIASVGTALFMLLLLLILWLARMVTIVPEQEEGIEVAFGDVENAGGFMAEQSEIVPLPTEPTTPPAASSDNELLTQEDESVAAERERQQQHEREQREAAERAQQEREQREREREQQQSINNFVQNVMSGSSNASSTGNSDGNQTPGNPVGKGSGSSNGHNWTLDGRDLIGEIPKPTYRHQEYGVVVIRICVNAAGKVISAEQTRGTNVHNTEMIQSAIQSAKQTKWSAGGEDRQCGTITYIFE